MSKLMIGGGDQTTYYRRKGWTVLDGYARYEPDILAEVPPLPKQVKAQQWNQVKAVHVIEHFFYEVADELLAGIYEVLEPGGRLVLEQGNLEWICKAILNQVPKPVDRYSFMGGDERWMTLWNLYPQPHMIDGNPYNYHLSGWSPSILTAAVVGAGFKPGNVTTGMARSHVRERDFRLEAIK